MTGIDPVSAEERQQAADKKEEERQDQIAQINDMAGKSFDKLDGIDKAGIALRLTWRNTFSRVSNIKWPGWGHLAAGLIDPRGPLMGVVGGVNKILSGGAEFAKDPSLVNFLKLMTDTATGITIILGSITALAGLIAGIMTALTILSLGTLAPISGPIIAFCATVMSTVGGWTISFGIIALILQALVFIGNLIKAATAENAEELQKQSEEMTKNVADAGNVAMQIGMAKLAQVGGRGLQSGIAEAGGGVRFAANMGAKGPVARVVTGVKTSGVKGFAGEVATGAGKAVRGAGAAVKAIPGKVATAAEKAGGYGKLALQTGKAVIKKLGAEGKEPLPAGKGFSREFLIGKDVPEGGIWKAAGEAREATTAKLLKPRVPAGELLPPTEPVAPGKPAAPRETPVSKEPTPPTETAAPRPKTGEEAPVPSGEKTTLDATAAKRGPELSPKELDAELNSVAKGKRTPVKEGGEYVEEVKLDNGHTWRKNREGRWCRFSNEPDMCLVGSLPGEPIVKPGEAPTTAETKGPAAAEKTETPTRASGRPQRRSAGRKRRRSVRNSTNCAMTA